MLNLTIAGVFIALIAINLIAVMKVNLTVNLAIHNTKKPRNLG
jgi:hypothetical protein